MKLGTGLFTTQRRPDDDRSQSEIHDEMPTLARTIDDAGLDSAWVSEHHFTDDGYLAAPMAVLGALAAETDDVEIGTSIALAPLHDQVRLAEDAATVDLLSDGRLSLGLAVGYRETEFEGFGVPRDERAARTEDLVRTLRAAWSDGPLDYDPEFHAASPDLTVSPKPENAPPIVLGGDSKPAVRRAARMGDGWIAPSSLSMGGLRKRVEDIERVREAEGIEGDFQVYVLQHGFVADSTDEAWDAMREGYLYLQRRYAEWYGGEPIDELPEERVAELKEQAIFGTPDQVVEELNTYADALGEDVHVILRTYFPGIGTDAMVECIERLGDEVVPQLP
ncbi:MAG TPA: LLM class flavin-dependent oxidoreductase [Natrialbaceae archaeon]|nr:LLM class flavin-dependent oxidoreductase [Natrialbaceae archaeon]